MEIGTLGIDIAKNVFQLHGINSQGEVVLRKRLPRNRVLEFIASLSPCLVGIEACGSSHYWGREIRILGHEVKLMPAQYVKPYVKRNKTDAADAQAICEAVRRPTMRFVAIKSRDQQAVLLQHRSRDLLVKQRTMLVNAVRAHMAEFGIIVPQGLRNITKLEEKLADTTASPVPEIAWDVLNLLFLQVQTLSEKIGDLEKAIAMWHKNNEASQRLSSITGIGPLTATAIVASIGDASAFASGREFAAWLYNPTGTFLGWKVALRGHFQTRGRVYPAIAYSWSTGCGAHA